MNISKMYDENVYLLWLICQQLPLEKKRQPSDYVINARCPVCGDSKKNPNKRRFYLLYEPTKNKITAYCHNCGYAAPAKIFLKEYFPVFYQDYIKELLAQNKPQMKSALPQKQPSKQTFKIPTSFQNVSKLSANHIAIQYLKQRKIPYKTFQKYLYFHPSFIDFTKNQNLVSNDKRLVIFAYNENNQLIFMNGRCLNKCSKYPRYLSYKLKNDAKLWGLDRLDKTKTIYILEGAFDAMFLPNSVAMFGGFITFNQLNDHIPLNKYKNNIVFILDNEPYNPNTVKYMKKVLNNGFKLFLWPEYLKGIKDINELVLKYNLSITDLTNLIESNIISGMKGELYLKTWLK